MSTTTWMFVAMEYYALILNRTFLIKIDDESLYAKKCRGVTSVDGGDPLTMQLAVSGDLSDPNSYIDEHQLANPNRDDFLVALKDIHSVTFNQRKKWGMGYYPHDGRVTIETANRKRELIILGHQSGNRIFIRLQAAIENAKT